VVIVPVRRTSIEMAGTGDERTRDSSTLGKRRPPLPTPGAPVALCPHHHRQEPSMKEQPTDKHPLSDLAYDWITLIQNKAQALMAYDQYIQDAEQAKSPECAAFFRKVHDADKAQLAEAKEHLVAVLQGKMGAG
jgi:hypothetical protein